MEIFKRLFGTSDVLQVKGFSPYSCLHTSEYRFYTTKNDDHLSVIHDTKCREIFHSKWRFPFRGIGFLPYSDNISVLCDFLKNADFKKKKVFYYDYDGVNATKEALVEKWKAIEDKLNLSDRTFFKKTHSDRIGVFPSVFWQNIPFKMGLFSLLFRSVLISIIKSGEWNDLVDKESANLINEFIYNKKTFVKYKFSNTCDVVVSSKYYKLDNFITSVDNEECQHSASKLKDDLLEYCSLHHDLNKDQIVVIDDFVNRWLEINKFQ